jgi:hypothetical protein
MYNPWGSLFQDRRQCLLISVAGFLVMRTSGVISRIANPVPPEVMMRFNPSMSAHDFTCNWIGDTSSGTMANDETTQTSGSPAKMSFSKGPDRSVDSSLEAVSLTLPVSIL